MKNYEWILFDADETLFHFDALTGLKHMFSQYGVTFTLHDFQQYQTFNKSLWLRYQNGDITSQELQLQRFSDWANKLQVTSKELSNAFMMAMAEACTPLDGAINLLNTLKGKARLGIITNGFIDLQHKRLERNGLKDHFDLLVISEQVGIAKPQRGIFEHALSIMGNPAKEKVLMVGDNPDTDILGGINMGLDTCWLNVDNKPASEGIKPHYQVTSLHELENMLRGKLGL